MLPSIRRREGKKKFVDWGDKIDSMSVNFEITKFFLKRYFTHKSQLLCYEVV